MNFSDASLVPAVRRSILTARRLRKLAPKAGLVETIWLLFLVGLTILMIDLGSSDAGTRIFGSRAQVLCLISAGFLALCSVSRIIAFATGHRSRYVRYDLVLFFLPFAFAPIAGFIDGGTALAMTRQFVPPSLSVEGSQNPITGADLITPGPAIVPRPILDQTGTMLFDAQNFKANYDAVYAGPKIFAGTKVRLEGFVIPSDEISMTGVVIGRNLIWCCSADGLMLGIPARMPQGATVPEAGTWVEMEGVLDSFEMAQGTVIQGQDMSGMVLPSIQIVSLVAKTMPKDPYLYP